MGKPQHTPERMCAACRSRMPKSSARRYVVDNTGQVVYDAYATQPGRGVYVCSQNCYDKIQYGLLPILTKAKKQLPKKRENV